MPVHENGGFVVEGKATMEDTMEATMEDTTSPEEAKVADKDLASHSSNDRIIINRRVYRQDQYEQQWKSSDKAKRSAAEHGKECCHKLSRSCCTGPAWKRRLLKFFPFIDILKQYKIRKDLPADIAAGITVGVVQIPQGMAYGLLAAVAPVFGLYSSFFPVLIYFFFGTSRHISMGTFAITSQMIGNVVEEAGCGGTSQPDTTTTMPNTTSTDMYTVATTENSSLPGSANTFTEEELCRIGVASMVALLAGLLQLLMGILQLGWLTIYLSDALSRGFTTACAVHVMTSQLKYLFGLKLTRYGGVLSLFYTYIEFLPLLPESNVAALAVSASCIFTLAVFKEHLQPGFKKKFKVMFPIELIVVIGATLASYYIKLEPKYDVDIVGNIPTGLPMPSVPNASAISLIPTAVSIAIVGYANSMSLAKLFAKKHKYTVDPTQELLAHGISNTACSFFSCIFACPSMSRTTIYEGAGAKTQLTGVFSTILVLLVLLLIGPLFEPLPKAVLGSLIVVGLKGMFKQATDIKRYWKVDKIDLSIWLVSFTATLLLNVDLGLMVSVVWTVLTIVARNHRAGGSVLGNTEGTDIYKSMRKFNKGVQYDGIRVFRWDSALHYANTQRFRQQLSRNVLRDKTPAAITQSNDNTSSKNTKVHTVILDFSCVAYIDSAGADCIAQVVDENSKNDIEVYLAKCSSGVIRTLTKAEFCSSNTERIFVEVHDAVQTALSAHNQRTHIEHTQSLPSYGQNNGEAATYM